MTNIFDRDCRACPRLAEFLDTVKKKYPDYYCRPVPSFGDQEAQLLIVGLAPGKHGAMLRFVDERYRVQQPRDRPLVFEHDELPEP